MNAMLDFVKQAVAKNPEIAEILIKIANGSKNRSFRCWIFQFLGDTPRPIRSN